MTDTVISVQNVSKCYRVFDSQRQRLCHVIWPHYKKGMQEINALKNINFEVKRGEAVAIIGRNGGGKSTLLEILTGTLTPTTGQVTVQGRVSALLELGSGFNPEYTGRDNVILNGLLLGLSKADILNRFNEIEAFAEIGSAIDRPVKTYSSGMMMRLAFAVQVLCDPDILIIDEALSVGDFFFQQKCLSYIRGLRERGVTLLFVSHDMGTVRELCPRVIYLREGAVQFDGVGTDGIALFFNEKTSTHPSSAIKAAMINTLSNQEMSLSQDLLAIDLKKSIWHSPNGPQVGKLYAVYIYDEYYQPNMTFQIGQKMLIGVAYIPEPSKVCHVCVMITDKYGTIITTTGSLLLNINDKSNNSGSRYFELALDLMLEAGEYGVSVSLDYETAKNRGQVLDQTGLLGPIMVTWDYDNFTAPFLGKVGLPVSASYIE